MNYHAADTRRPNARHAQPLLDKTRHELVNRPLQFQKRRQLFIGTHDETLSFAAHVYEVRPRKDKRGVDLISDALPFGRLWYGEPNGIGNAIGYAEHYSRSHYTVIRVYDDAGKVIETARSATAILKNREILFICGNLVFVLSALLVAVQFDVALGRFTLVMHRMQMMSVRNMRMMRRHFVFASTMMLGRFAMVLCGVFVVFSSFRVMFFQFLWH